MRAATPAAASDVTTVGSGCAALRAGSAAAVVAVVEEARPGELDPVVFCA